MKISSKVDYDMWLDVASSCPYATYFHSPLWHRLILDTYDDLRCASISLVSEEGRRAILPLMEIGHVARVLRTRASTFAGCYGGIIADGPIARKEVKSIYAKGVGLAGKVRITGNPLWSSEVDSPPMPSFERMKVNEDSTHILGLDESIDSIISNFSEGHQRGLKRGVSMGVSVREANSLADYLAYYEAYKDSLRRWGKEATSRYPRRLFINGYNLSQKHPQNTRLWLAELQGKVIAGAWVLYWNRHADYWHGAGYEEFFPYRPNNVLHEAIIRDAVDGGYKYYDFNPSGGHEGVTRFKKQFGAEEWSILRWTTEGPLVGVVRTIRKYV